MIPGSTGRSSFTVWLAAASIAALSLGGCAGGLPDIHAIASLSLGDQDADKAKTSEPPSLADLIQPGALDDVAIGKANAPVTIVQYVSLTCTTCGKFQTTVLPKLKKAYVDKGKARIVFREFPEDNAAMTAALALRCVPEKEFLGTMEKLLTHQKEWAGAEANKDALYKLVKGGGLKRDKFDACLTDKTVTDGLTAAKERAAGFGVTVTPSFFVNEKKVQGAVSAEEMQHFIDAAFTATQTPAAAQPQTKPKA
jgi:protein-disulfide isomerase